MKKTLRLTGVLVAAMLAGPASMREAVAAAPPPVVAAAPLGAAREAPARDYAAREIASAPKVEGFRGGGSGLYIGGSTVAVVLLIVLLIILL
jgi:hypothetical protein